MHIAAGTYPLPSCRNEVFSAYVERDRLSSGSDLYLVIPVLRLTLASKG